MKNYLQSPSSGDERIAVLLNNARALERKSMVGPRVRATSLPAIKEKVEGLARYNRAVEDAIKMEILGMRDDPLGRLLFRAKSYFRREVEPANVVIGDQIGRVDEVIEDLRHYQGEIGRKIETLEEHYSRVLLSLLEKHEEARELAAEVRDGQKLLSGSAERIDPEANPSSRVSYIAEHRRIRRGISRGAHKLKVNDRAIALMEKELPILDSLGSIADAYFFALEEIAQESESMRTHLEVVCDLYLDMIRAGRLNAGLEDEVAKLFDYTSNIGTALERGTRTIMQRANRQGIVEANYSSKSKGLDVLVGKVEAAAFTGIAELERRITSYSLDERRP